MATGRWASYASPQRNGWFSSMRRHDTPDTASGLATTDALSAARDALKVIATEGAPPAAPPAMIQPEQHQAAARMRVAAKIQRLAAAPPQQPQMAEAAPAQKLMIEAQHMFPWPPPPLQQVQPLEKQTPSVPQEEVPQEIPAGMQIVEPSDSMEAPSEEQPLPAESEPVEQPVEQPAEQPAVEPQPEAQQPEVQQEQPEQGFDEQPNRDDPAATFTESEAPEAPVSAPSPYSYEQAPSYGQAPVAAAPPYAPTAASPYGYAPRVANPFPAAPLLPQPAAGMGMVYYPGGAYASVAAPGGAGGAAVPRGGYYAAPAPAAPPQRYPQRYVARPERYSARPAPAPAQVYEAVPIYAPQTQEPAPGEAGREAAEAEDQCSVGKAQSPIDVEVNVVSATLPVLGWQILGNAPTAASFAVSPASTEQGAAAPSLSVVGLGEAPGGVQARMEVHGESYLLSELDMASPSEHAIAGQRADLELQFVHATAAGAPAQARYMVVSALLRVAPISAPAIAGLAARLEGAEAQGFEGGAVALDLQGLAMAVLGQTEAVQASATNAQSYFQYQGSFTSSPCSEGVTWIVTKNAVAVSQADLTILRRVLGRAPRPLQALNGRTVLDSLVAPA